MNKNLLLINPWIYDFTAYDLWSKPLGLLYIGSFLRNFGYNISFIDCLDKYNFGWRPKIKKYGQGNFYRTEIKKPTLLNHIPRGYARYGIPIENFIQRVKQVPKPDVVLITSMMTYWYQGPKNVVNLIRKTFPGIPIILGGIYATLLPKHAKKEVAPDYIINGPGEIKVLQLLDKLFNYDRNYDECISDLDDLPYPAFDLIQHHDYMTVLTARGCPYNCSFCAQKQVSMPFQQRSPAAVVDEIKYHYKKFRVRDFAFYDDALFINRDNHIKLILQQIIESRLPIRFHSPNGLFAKYIDMELAELMYKGNFKTIRLSFETSNEDRKIDMFSKVSNDDMIYAVENLEKAGYSRSKIDAYALMGLPDQDLNEILKSMIFLNNLGVQIKLASFSPIHGTLDFERAVKLGQIEQNVDPLLTNKSIFPLSNNQFNYQTFKKIRQFSQVLNYAAQKKINFFGDSDISSTLHTVLRN